MPNIDRIGIIDIGSNSIRLVIYERLSALSHRILDESKAAARLSERVRDDGTITPKDIMSIVDILIHFKQLCEVHETTRIRAVATAAIRNAANREEIVQLLEHHTGLAIEVLSGKDEARFGFIGMVNTINIQDGFLVDIGGGSTEICLFLQRKLLHSVSFPFGSVNTAKRYASNGQVSESQQPQLRAMVMEALKLHPWILSHPGLPIVGLGGTFRSVAKLNQRRTGYSLQLTHHYKMNATDTDELLQHLSPLPIEQLKKIDGMSKDRADITVPGLYMIQTLLNQMGAKQIIVSGSGLRDGIFYESLTPDKPVLEDALEYSIRNLLELNPYAAVAHVEQVDRIVLKLWDHLAPSIAGIPNRGRKYLHTAALLYRMGITIHYYNYQRHTFYMMLNARIGGLSHREIILCALIASYQSKNRCRRLAAPYKNILNEGDLLLAIELGTLLQLAIALDRSETQTVADVHVKVRPKELELSLQTQRSPMIELRELEALEKDFKKVWKRQLNVTLA